jgi:hypothetical protein
MLDPKDLRRVVDATKHEVLQAMLFPTDSEVIRFQQQLAQEIAKALPVCFPETIHAIIGRSVESVLSEVMARTVSEGIERAIRPLAEELARIRHFIADDNESDNWWRNGRGPDQEPDPEDGEAA